MELGEMKFRFRKKAILYCNGMFLFFWKVSPLGSLGNTLWRGWVSGDTHFFESLWTSGCAIRRVANSRKITHFRMKNRKTCESAKSNMNFLSVEQLENIPWLLEGEKQAEILWSVLSLPLWLSSQLFPACYSEIWDLGIFRKTHGSVGGFTSLMLGDQQLSLCCTNLWRRCQVTHFTRMQ